jgi:hypothetical protein
MLVSFGAHLIPQFTRSVSCCWFCSLPATATRSPMFWVDFHFLQSQVRSFSLGTRGFSLFYVKCIWCSDFFLSLRSFSTVHPWCGSQVCADQLFLSCLLAPSWFDFSVSFVFLILPARGLILSVNIPAVWSWSQLCQHESLLELAHVVRSFSCLDSRRSRASFSAFQEAWIYPVGLLSACGGGLGWSTLLLGVVPCCSRKCCAYNSSISRVSLHHRLSFCCRVKAGLALESPDQKTWGFVV